jgi:hypothetical protein
MTIMTPATDTTQPAGFLTGFDILDAYTALQNAAAIDTTSLTIQDRQALAYLTYWPGLRGMTRMLVSKLANGTATLPMSRTLAVHIIDFAASLPPVTREDEDAWLAVGDADTPCVIDRIIGALATDAATRIHTPEGHTLYGALQTVIRIGRPDMPLDDVPGIARCEIDTAVADLDAAGLMPEPQPDPVLETLAHYAAEYGNTGATRTMLIAAIMTHNGDAAPDNAVELARTDRFDDRVSRAGDIADAMVARIRRAKLTAIDDQTDVDEDVEAVAVAS